MAAAVERPYGDHFQHHARDGGGDERQDRAEHETIGQACEGGGEIGAEHVERAVRQIDEIHDPKNERQPGREQKQQHPKLHAVEALLDEIQHLSPYRPEM